MPSTRKSSTLTSVSTTNGVNHLPPTLLKSKEAKRLPGTSPLEGQPVQKAPRRARGSDPKPPLVLVEDGDPHIEGGPEARAASPDSVNSPLVRARKRATKVTNAIKTVAGAVDGESPEVKTKRTVEATKTKGLEAALDPESDVNIVPDEEEVVEALSRPPPVHSPILPLPWKGRLGYACLNTYLRNSNPPIFCSRTCRIASILDHRHPLTHADQPEHATKNRPDKTKPADVSRGMAWVHGLALANVADAIKLLRWNERYGIKFLRLSSEMFPFASHDEYGYRLSTFAGPSLREVGRVVAELGHRVTMHPGQFTQLGSPRPSVISGSIRDLEYHDELLTLLELPDQQNRDAVMILHMGGVFGDKGETLARFRKNYANLSPSIKRRLVLENDDVSWSVHDLLPICEELNIPLVLDWHHHNIVHHPSLREGTADILPLLPRIAETWRRKGITQKMHYSEPTPNAITGRQRRKHAPRVATLPPCGNDMDLMIEAKDKEQAVFELMLNFKLPGFEKINPIIPHSRDDFNKIVKGRKGNSDLVVGPNGGDALPQEMIGMGGAEGRVYWPPFMEEWLRPKKREIKKKANGSGEDSDGVTLDAVPSKRGRPKTTAKAKTARSAPTKANRATRKKAAETSSEAELSSSPKLTDSIEFSDATETESSVGRLADST